MNPDLFMGMLISAIAVLCGIAVAVATLIIKPLNNLTNSITKLATKIEYLEKEKQEQNRRLESDEKKLDEHERLLIVHEETLDSLVGGKNE